MKDIISVKNFSFSYGSKEIFDKANITFSKGELTLFCAPNGAGKTTFFNILNGKIKDYKGNIFFSGRNIKELTPKEIAQTLTTIE